MTKDEIAQNNLEIARLVYPECRVEGINYTKTDSIAVFTKDVNLDSWDFLGEFDYYSNWEDLMPLAVEHGIELTLASNTKKKWSASKTVFSVESGFAEIADVDNDDPQHALADCLLEVLRHKAKEKGNE